MEGLSWQPSVYRLGKVAWLGGMYSVREWDETVRFTVSRTFQWQSKSWPSTFLR